MIEQGVHECAGVIPGGRMYDESRRFVQYDNVAVLVDAGKRNGFRQDLVDFSLGKFKRYDVSKFGLVSRLLDAAVHERKPFPDQSLDPGAGDGGLIMRDEDVQALADMVFGNGEGFLGHGNYF